MGNLWWDRPITVAGIDIGAGQATLHVLTSYGVAQDIELRTNDDGLVDRFEVSLQPPAIKTWADIDAELTKSGARYSYQVSKVTDGRKCSTVAGTNTDLSLPLASIFKLYVLLAVAEAVNAGTLEWTDPAHHHRRGEGGRIRQPRRAAARRAGVGAQGRAADDFGERQHGDRSADRPAGARRRRARAGDRGPSRPGEHDAVPDHARAVLGRLGSTGPSRAVEAGFSAGPRAAAGADEFPPLRTGSEAHPTPASEYGAEWYGSAADICRVHAALQAAAVGEAAPVKEILSAVPGIELDKSKWPYIGAKGGNLPGDLTFSWYAVDRTGQPWVVSFQLNWPRFRSQTAAGWLLAIVNQTFELVPMGLVCSTRRDWVAAQDLSDPAALMGLCPRPHRLTLR